MAEATQRRLANFTPQRANLKCSKCVYRFAYLKVGVFNSIRKAIEEKFLASPLGLSDMRTPDGVTVEIDRSDSEELGSLYPVPIEADGPPDALIAFIRDQFANQALACSMPKRDGG